MDRLDQQINRWGNTVTLVSAAGAVIAYLGGLVHQIQHFPLWAKIPLFVFGSIFVVVLILRVVVFLRHYRHRPPGRGAPPGSTIGVMSEGMSGGSLDVRDVRFIQGSPPPPALIVPTSRALLERLAEELRTASREAGPTLRVEAPETSDNFAEWDTVRAARDAAEDAAVVAFRDRHFARFIALYQDARQRGFQDQRLEINLGTFPQVRSLRDAEEIVTLMAALAERIELTLRQASEQAGDGQDEAGDESP
jgi:uncharacterized membrane protein YhdT